MYLIRVRGLSFRIKVLIPNGISLEIPEDKEILKLIERIKEGDQDAENRLFYGYFRFALFIAGQYAMRIRSLMDDLAQEAQIGLITAIRDIPTKLKENKYLTTYLAQKIHGRLYAFIRKQFKRVIYDTTITEMGTIVVKLKEYRKNRSRDMFQEIRDYLKDKREEEIITLRLEGYNDVEIAEKIGLTKMRISQIRREIGKRIDKNDLLRTRRN